MATDRLLSKDAFEVDFGNDISGKRIKRTVHFEKEAKRQLAEFEKAQKGNYEWWFLRTKIEQATIVGVAVDSINSNCIQSPGLKRSVSATLNASL